MVGLPMDRSKVKISIRFVDMEMFDQIWGFNQVEDESCQKEHFGQEKNAGPELYQDAGPE